MNWGATIHDLLLSGMAFLVFTGCAGLVLPRATRRYPVQPAVILTVGLAAFTLLQTLALLLLPTMAFSLPLISALLGWARLLLVCRGRLRFHGLGRGGTLFIGLGAVVVLMLVNAQYLVPPGYDPSFHCILVQKIADTGRLATSWEPFESVPVNYPQGLHALLAAVTHWTGLAAHRSFLAGDFWLSLLHLACFAALARRLRLGATPQTWIVVVYFCVCNYGAPLSYIHWGGLPTIFAQALFLAATALVLVPARRGNSFLCGVLFAAMLASHHLTSLIGGLVLAAYLGVCLWRQYRPAVRRLLSAVGWQLLLAAPFLWLYARRLGTLSTTNVMRYVEEPCYLPHVVGQMFGWILVPLALGGAWLWYRRHAVPRHQALLLCWLTTLLSAFVILDYGFRALAYWRTGLSYTLLAPSRFITLCSYPAAILAAGALSWANRHWPRYRVTAALGLACLAGLGLHLPKHFNNNPVSAATQTLYRWVQDQTPANAVVCYPAAAEYAQRNWQCYFTWREAEYTGLPAPEPRAAPVILRKHAAVNSGDPERLLQWLETSGKPGFLLTRYRRGVSPCPWLTLHAEHAGFALWRWQRAPRGGPRQRPLRCRAAARFGHRQTPPRRGRASST